MPPVHHDPAPAPEPDPPSITDGSAYGHDADVAAAIHALLHRPGRIPWRRLIDIYTLLDSYAGPQLRDAATDHDWPGVGSRPPETPRGG